MDEPKTGYPCDKCGEHRCKGHDARVTNRPENHKQGYELDADQWDYVPRNAWTEGQE